MITLSLCVRVCLCVCLHVHVEPAVCIAGIYMFKSGAV